jgi:hypothetical protein
LFVGGTRRAGVLVLAGWMLLVWILAVWVLFECRDAHATFRRRDQLIINFRRV